MRRSRISPDSLVADANARSSMLLPSSPVTTGRLRRVLLHLSYNMALSRLLDTTPPRLFTVAACGSLKPAPDGRPRGAYPHLLCSSALPLLVVSSRRTLVQMPSIAWARPTLAQSSRNRRAELQHPTPHRFIGDFEHTLGEQFLHIAVAQREAEIE